MFTVVGEFTSSGTNSDVINTIVRGIDGSNSATNSEKRGTIMGTVTHFGLAGVDPAVDDCDMLYGTDDSACGPGYCRAPSDCGETLPRSWDPDLTGPYNHATYGGWYLTFHYGTPAELSITRIQMPEGSVNMQAFSLPPSITTSDVSLVGESKISGSYYSHTYTLGTSVAEVRAAPMGDVYYIDPTHDVLYYRVYTYHVDTDSNFQELDREANGIVDFVRHGVSITDTTQKNNYLLKITVDCEVDTSAVHGGAYCTEQPTFNVPPMGCPDGQVMTAIDECGDPCELAGSCPPSPPAMPPAPPPPPSMPPPPPMPPPIPVSKWAVSEVGDWSSCDTVCAALGTAYSCDEDDFYAHNNEVDTAAEMSALMTELGVGRTCNTNSLNTQYGTAGSVPRLQDANAEGKATCWLTDTDRTTGFSCSDTNTNRRRLCWCSATVSPPAPPNAGNDAVASPPPSPPPPSPSASSGRGARGGWHLSTDRDDDCDDVCAANGGTCDADGYDAKKASFVFDAAGILTNVGTTCSSVTTLNAATSPRIHPTGRACYLPSSNQATGTFTCDGTHHTHLRVCYCS